MAFNPLILTLEDVLIGTRTIWMEARGESLEGRIAVGHVIKNRRDYKLGDRWNTIGQVCLDWLQFSGWRENDPNFTTALKLTSDDKLFRECQVAFLISYDSRDTTGGSRHYHANYMTPNWAAGHRPVMVLGRHIFYNDVR